MSKTTFDYPVYFPYGATTDPYSPSNPHKGDDRCNAEGVPIEVNGVVIGYTGHTGYIVPNNEKGAHLHTGRYVNGSPTNPNGGGKTLKNPVMVTTVGYDSRNGNYVRLTDGDGVQWVYLHMSKTNVKVGQTLQKGEPMVDANHLNALTMAYFNRGASNEEVKRYVGLAPYTQVIEEFDKSAEYKAKKEADAAAYASGVKLNPGKYIVG